MIEENKIKKLLDELDMCIKLLSIGDQKSGANALKIIKQIKQINSNESEQ